MVMLESMVSKKFIGGVLALTVMLSAQSDIAAEPLLKSDFEKNGLEGWRLWLPPTMDDRGCQLEVSSPAEGRDERSALRVSSESAASFSVMVRDPLPVRGGESLRVSAWYRGDAGARIVPKTPGIFLRLPLYTDDGTPPPVRALFVSVRGEVIEGIPTTDQQASEKELKWSGLPKDAASSFREEAFPETWTKIEAVVQVPAGTGKIGVELFSYRTEGAIFWSDIVVEPAEKGSAAVRPAPAAPVATPAPTPQPLPPALVGKSVEEITAPALEAPTINTSPLPEYSLKNLDYGMTIGIERTPKGRLWACWVGGGDNDKAFFVLAHSDNDGETWSDTSVVVDPHDDAHPLRRRTVVGNLWTDPKGRLWLFFDQSMGMFDGRGGSWYTICENPDAAEPTWSQPVRIWHGMTLCKPTVLSNGEWILPISLWDRKTISSPLKDLNPFPELDEHRGAHVFASKDEGKTWERRGMVRFPSARFDEHMFIERKDGSLWMTARTRNGMWESVSKDGGRTWEQIVASPIMTASARHFIRRLESGHILLVKHGEKIDDVVRDEKGTAQRTHMTAFLSDDDGRTWKGGLVLDQRERVSYPDGFQAPDGTIYVSWDRKRNDVGEILMARFTEADVLSGSFSGPKSKTKILISRPPPEKIEARKQKEAEEKAAQGEGA